MAELKVTIPVEKAVHDALRTLFQRVLDEHGLQIDSVHARWVETSEVGKRGAKLVNIDLGTTTLY